MNEADILVWEHDPFAQVVIGTAQAAVTPVARPVLDFGAPALPITLWLASHPTRG